MTKLQIKNLYKNFESTKILEDINLKIEDGEFVVLVGPSGSGKSTILRIIAGLETPTSGEVIINNKVINDLKPKDRDIAMVFQNYALYPHMNIYDNLAFPLKMKHVEKTKIEKSVNDTSSMLGIQHYLKKKPKELSGGERQRVALGRAIIREPQLFLMDEPLSNLDAKLRTQMRAELLKLHKSLSSTVIYVTHDQIEALTMGNKIAILNHGKIQQLGTPDEIYNDPANTFVAGFIGNPGMNLFTLEIISNTKVLFQETPIELTNTSHFQELIKKNNLTNKKFILGIRPEHLLLNEEKDITLSANIDLIEMLGNEFLIYANVRNSGSNFSIKVTDKCNLKRNDKIKVTIDIKKAYFFDEKTQKRIYF